MSVKKEIKYFWFDAEKLRFTANIPFIVDRTTKLLLKSSLSTVELIDVNDATYAFVDDAPVGKVNIMPKFLKKLTPKRYLRVRKRIEVFCSPQSAREIISMCPEAKVYPDNKRVKVVIPL
jgi:hypothetical protein